MYRFVHKVIIDCITVIIQIVLDTGFHCVHACVGLCTLLSMRPINLKNCFIKKFQIPIQITWDMETWQQTFRHHTVEQMNTISGLYHEQKEHF